MGATQRLGPAHQLQGIDREIRVVIQGHAVAPCEALKVVTGVGTLGGNGRRGLVAGGMKYAAQ